MYLPDNQDNPILRNNYFSSTKASTFDVLSTTLHDTLRYNPLSVVSRTLDYYSKEKQGKKLSKDAWSTSPYFREGIEVGEDGIHEEAAKFLAEDFDRRREINLVLDRSRGGIGLMSAQFAVGLVGSALDPLNVAASFIPGVGVTRHVLGLSKQAQRAAQQAKVATVGQRFTHGFAGGVAGSMPTEALIQWGTRVTQDQDYTMMDSFMNATFGGILGGGLHAVGGIIGNRLSRASQQSKDMMATAAVSQAVQGKAINVDALVETDPYLKKTKQLDLPKDPRELRADDYGLPEGTRVRVAGAERLLDPQWEKKGTAYPKVLSILSASKDKKPKRLMTFIRNQGGIASTDKNAGEVRQLFGNDPKKYGTVLKKGGIPLDEMALRAQEAGYFETRLDPSVERVDIADLIYLMEDDEGRSMGTHVYSAFDINSSEYKNAQDLLEEALTYGIDPRGMTDDVFFAALNERRSQFDPTQMPDEFDVGREEPDYTAAMQQDFEDYNQLGMMDDYRASLEEHDRLIADSQKDEVTKLDQELAQLEDDIAYLQQLGFIDETELKAIDDLSNQEEVRADAMEEAARAGASCLYRS